MRITILFFFSLFIFLTFSCQNENKNNNRSPNGYWQQMGYGKIIHLNNDTVKIYDQCKVSCQLYEETLLDEIGKIKSYDSDSLIIQKNIKTYRFLRIPTLPKNCQYDEAYRKDPVLNFETLWHTFNEQYCYFEDRNISWDSIYQIYQPQINQNTSDLELYSILEEMTTALEDGHVELELPEHLEEEVLKNKKEEKELKSRVNSFELGLQTQSAIANHYCNEVHMHNGGNAKWGMMKDSIAYIQINAMFFLAFYDITKGLGFMDTWKEYREIASNRTFQRQDEIDGANQLLDSIIIQTQGAKAYVLDFRFNIGGKDEAGLGIIGHFTDKKIKVATKKAKLEEGFTNHQNIFLEPKTPHFTGNVYLLTSHETASAAELASMSTFQLDNIKRIGSHTEGIFSDQLEKRLPNGWEFILSNEIYEDMNGNHYENIGIPPNIPLEYPKDKVTFFNLLLQQLSENGDEAIEKVFQLENG